MIEIKDDDRFERDGDNLVMDLPLSFSQAALGIAYTVPTPYGDERVTIPAGTQGGTILKLRGKGLPKLGQNGRGDLLIGPTCGLRDHLRRADSAVQGTGPARG